MAKKTDPLAETRRVHAELDEARAAWLANRDDPQLKARHDRAQQAVAEDRRFWRNAGIAAGVREEGHTIRVAHNEAVADVPTLLGKAV